ncbi:alpha-L-fucosidase [Sphingomonas sp. BT-65]|uniref:alpha-L-fucosidase n=1 Tax=Sphingomonas sp. BT-65 TaxID=2989821 RepID=UPI002235FB56|nr:alpha-L-fucosidase [Sphingomonas sp. BT-65]MCW4461981.1 alpha-L-fucosidase [Sphingomonas sp. BT-65]
MITRRNALAGGAAAMLAGAAHAGGKGAQGPVRPDWASLTDHFRSPDWFRDAKLGLWSHWGPQCVPEFGDWYGRLMYIQGHPTYEHHLRTYGHPSKFGFMEFIPRWRADKWQPEVLVAKYKAAGARYIVSMANHHDNLDMFDSSHHPWNTTRIGPKRDIVGTWQRAVRAAGLRFGVSNHSAHAWHWWQTAYGYDAEGPMRGVRYDAFRLRKADGKGRWWQGFDPQLLYTGPSMVVPNGLGSMKEMATWHEANDGKWLENVPANNPGFAPHWLARQKDLVEKYRPDLVYMDNFRLPLERFGLEAAAHYYNQSIAMHGAVDVVLTAKTLTPEQRRAATDDVERGFVADIRPEPWQTCTCLGSWHYDRPLYERKGYKTAKQVIQRLLDIVSKNGNLLLSIPQRGDGSIDDEEEKVLDGMARWMAVNAEAIHGSRPWRRYGEGPMQIGEGMFNEDKAVFSAADIRFTANRGKLYAAVMDWPREAVTIAALAEAAVERVTLLGHGPVAFERGTGGLRVTLPPPDAGAFVPVLRIEGGRVT